MKLRVLSSSVSLAVACSLAACGGGGSSDSAAVSPSGNSPSSVVTYGAITGFGSVFVNGTRFDVTNAQVSDNGRGASSDDLKVGQVIRLEAKDNHDGTPPRASRIDRDSAVEGAITAIDVAGGTITILGQKIVVDSATMFDDSISPASLGGLSVGMNVEVDGFVAADGTIHATRIEPHAAAADHEVTGKIAALDTTAKTFQIGALTVSYATATLSDFPASGPANGDLVEVKGTAINASGQLVATRLELKRFDDSTMRAADEVEIEGLITRFASATDFDVGTRKVTTTASTRFSGGAASALALNIAVEVEGRVNSDGVLVADKVNFHEEPNVRIDGNVDSIDTTAGTLKMLGITVKVDPDTRLDDRGPGHDHFIALSKLAVGDHIEVRGVQDPAGGLVLTATRLERESGSATRVELRGSIATLAQPNFTILSATIATTSSTSFEGVSSNALFASTTHPFVKVVGTWDGTTLTAQKVELETSESMDD